MYRKTLSLGAICGLVTIHIFAASTVWASENIYKNPAEKGHNAIHKYENDWSFDINTQFEITTKEPSHSDAGTPIEILQSVENPEDEDQTPTSKFIAESGIDNKILDQIPYGDNIKHMWNIVDGDTDIYFEGLRADRRNMGLSYTTTELPVIGKLNDIELEFTAGETNEISFKTHSIPFMGKLQGFTLKGTAGDDENKIFARYTVKFD